MLQSFIVVVQRPVKWASVWVCTIPFWSHPMVQFAGSHPSSSRVPANSVFVIFHLTSSFAGSSLHLGLIVRVDCFCIQKKLRYYRTIQVKLKWNRKELSSYAFSSLVSSLFLQFLKALPLFFLLIFSTYMESLTEFKPKFFQAFFSQLQVAYINTMIIHLFIRYGNNLYSKSNFLKTSNEMY